MSYKRRPPAWPRELLERVRTYYRFENAGLSEMIGRDVNEIWYNDKTLNGVEKAIWSFRFETGVFNSR